LASSFPHAVTSRRFFLRMLLLLLAMNSPRHALRVAGAAIKPSKTNVDIDTGM